MNCAASDNLAAHCDAKQHRTVRRVRKLLGGEVAVGGVLADYVPFYFTNRSPMLQAIAAAACLVLLCSCATAPIWLAKASVPSSLPEAVAFNKGAGRGYPLFLTLRLEDGEELLFPVDTGAPYTILDKTFEPKLGKRFGTTAIRFAGGAQRGGVFKAPKLFLGKTQLVTAPRVVTADLRRLMPGWPVAGILGMDCLRHYCIQLDFVANEMRFLDPARPQNEHLGKAFPLKHLFFRRANSLENLAGAKGQKTAIDTGCNFDGTLKPKLFHQQLKKPTTSFSERLNIKWADSSADAAVRQLKQPVLLIAGAKDVVCPTNDLGSLEQIASPGSKGLVIPEANRRTIRYWFHEIQEQVKAWFQEHLSASATTATTSGPPMEMRSSSAEAHG